MQKKNKAIEIVKGRLFWISEVEPPKNIPKSFYFNIDNDLVYDSFNKDFGPLNLGKTWKYVSELQKLMAEPDYKSNTIYHHTGIEPQKVANAAYLICAYQIISMGCDASKAFEPFSNIGLKPFRDAGYGDCSYKCTVLDCLKGLEYAIKLGWFNYKSFNLPEYEHYEKIENGDLNWILPNKFIAFSSPSDQSIDKYGNRVYTPNDYVPIFKKLGVSLVVRLNNKTYDANDFKKNGIKHKEMYFPDGSVPPLTMVQQFNELAQKEEGTLAVHCKAGLGRTGTLIACFAMKHYYFPAAAFIGWIRIARPGSILGPQQNYLIEMQSVMREQGKHSPIWKQIQELINEKQVMQMMNNVNIKSQMNMKQKQIMKYGEKGQGENLMQLKLKKENSQRVGMSKQTKSPKSNSFSNKYPVVQVTICQYSLKNEFK